MGKDAEQKKAEETEGKVIFSAIQPTGVPHLGNYLGALKQWVDLQESEPSSTKLIFSIVDLHALTSLQAKKELSARVRETFASLLALGLDPTRCIIYQQSTAHGIPLLMWVLSSTASMGYLSRMTQWKSKIGIDGNISSPFNESIKAKLKLGLFAYPVLQAADVLYHRATHVPVGADQAQHIEFVRECARNFNATWGSIFPEPKTLLSPTTRIMSLTNPRIKMSKSDASAASRILITDNADDIQRKIKGALTDSQAIVSWDPEHRPGVANLLNILSAFDERGQTAAQLGATMSDDGRRNSDLKRLVADTLVIHLAPVRQRYLELTHNSRRRYLEDALRTGCQKAAEEAVLADVLGALGVDRPSAIEISEI